MTSGPKLISPSDIAEMISGDGKLRRSSVSNWRANPNLSFPLPVAGTEIRPLFDYDEVVAWLGENRPDVSIRTTRADVGLWDVAHSSRGDLTMEQLAGLLLAMACAKKIASTDRDVSAEWARLLDVDGSNAVNQYQRLAATNYEPRGLLELEPEAQLGSSGRYLGKLARAIDVIDVDELDRVVTGFLERAYGSVGRISLESGAVGSRVSAVLANAAATRPDARIFYDPSAGLCDTLLTIASKRTNPTLLADEVNPRALRMARQRAFLSGASIDLAQASVLNHDSRPGLRADVVVLEPPFGTRWNDEVDQFDPRWQFGLPSRSSSELLWIQHAVAHLDEGGRAFVVTPLGTLHRSGVDEQVRRGLLENGCIERVIAMPTQMLASTSIPTALWVLRSPSNASYGDVTFVDAVDIDRDEIPGLVGTLLAEETNAAEDVAMTIKVSAERVIIEGANLLPGRWCMPPEVSEKEAKGSVDQSREHLKVQLTNAPPLSFPELERVVGSRFESVGALLKNGVQLIVGRGRDGDANAVYSEPGDVILHTVSRIQAYVDEQGGRLLTGSIVALRLGSRDLLDPYYLAGMLTGSWNNRHFAGSAMMRVKPRDLEIPVLPLAAQREVGAHFRALAETRSWADSLTQAVDVYRGSILDALGVGFAPTGTDTEVSA